MLNRDQLLDLARGRAAAPFDRSIDVQVSRLRRKGAHTPALYPDDPNIVAVATDDVLDTSLPQLDVNDAEAVAHFIIQHLGLNRARLVR